MADLFTKNTIYCCFWKLKTICDVAKMLKKAYNKKETIVKEVLL